MKNSYLGLRPVAGAAIGAVLFLLLPAGARAANQYLLSSHVPAALTSMRLQPTGDLPDTNRLHLAIGLPLRDQTGLNKLLQQIYDPNSPQYRHYLSVEQFTEKFGPSKADYDSLQDFAHKNLLQVTAVHPNRMLLDVDMSVADIRRVFHVNIRTYNHPSENRQFYAPDTEPTLDLTVPVLHISGLDNYVRPHPLGHKSSAAKGRASPLRNGSNNAPLGGSGDGGLFFANDFRNAYAPGVTLTGAGQNAALFEYDGYYASDITAYEQQANFPNVNLVNVPIDGGIFGPPDGGEDEVASDIELVIAMAPGISTVFVYESPLGPPDDVFSRMATDNSSKQISVSWIYQTDATSDQLFQEFAAQGQSCYQASGDSDAYVGPIAASEEDPYIILVGGTELEMNGKGVSYASESVWNNGYSPPGGNPQRNNYWGSGGGISTDWALPVWQQGISMTANLGSTNFRNLPDVALVSDNILIISENLQYEGGWEGTSAAAPLWNGFTALVNQQAAIYSLHPVGFINPAVYKIGKGANYELCFHDTTVGNNFWPGSPTNFPAVPGYDLCTGWGTPMGSNLINALEPPLDIPALFVVTNFLTGGNNNGVVDYDECNNLTFLITNEGPAEATGIQGFLYSTTMGAIVAQSTASFPDLLPGQSARNIMPFTLSTEPSFICGTPVDLVLVLKCNQTVDTNDVELSSGIVGPPVVFGNPQPSSVPEGDFTGILSPVTVSGLQSAAKITVSVYATVAYAEALIFELVSPNGTTIVLSGGNGALSPNYGNGCSLTSETTFDDDALTPITAGTAPFVGSFQPEQPLSTFLPASGTNLNGVWQLNVVEEFVGIPATLECWSLNVEPYDCVEGGGQCPGSDLSLTMTAKPNPVLVSSNVVFTLNVSNAGPSTAEGVVISQSLPPGFGFVTTSNYPVRVTPNLTNLTLSLGALPVYGTAMVSVVTIPTIPGLATSVATVGSTSTDPNLNNNTASASTLVELPTADLGISMTALPTSLLQGGLVTFTIIVTNNGPFTATGVVLTNFLPANVNYVSSTTSQGSISVGGGLANLGTLPFGSNAVVTETVSPTTTGNITDTAQVGLSPLDTDPVTFNNTASFTVTVGPSADLGVSATVTPSTVVAGNNSIYVATVVNNGPSSATAVVFNQTIPGGTGLNAATFVSSSEASVTVTNGSITWSIGSMASGASVFITNVLQSPTIQPGGRPIILSSTFSVFGQPGDANTNNNVVTIQNVDETPTVTIVAVSATLIAQNGFSNGVVNPGETVGVQLFLQNTGNVSTTNLVATLQATGGVTLPSGYQTYGALAPGAPPVGGAFSFKATSTNGGTVVATLSLQDGASDLGTVSFDFFMPVIQTFWNTNPIYIPALQYTPFPDDGPASPYPSSIQVSNVTGYVSKVTVTVSNMSHTYPHDIGLLLVGPGTNTVLMDAAVQGFEDMTDTTLTFDSTALNVLPSTGDVASGTYQPADYNANDVFTNAVTLSAVTNAVVPPYSANLTNFNGLPPNGVWSLYAHDDVAGDAGGISNGWAVTITTITPVNPTNSLAASITSTNQLILGGFVTNLLNVTNNGATAVNAFLTNLLPAGLSFVSATGSPGSFTQNGQSILYNLGNLSPGAGVTITNVVMANASGLQTNTITAGVPSAAFNIGDNSATAITAVNLPLAQLAAGISVSPNPDVVTSNLTYTLSVTNIGPSNAVNTIGAFALTGLQLVSVSTSQGSDVATNGTVQCALGTIPAGDIATVVITATPLSVGTLTNVWSVSTGSADTNLTDNSASVVVTVTYAAPIIAADGATLLAQGLTPPNGAINSNETVTVAFTLTNEGSAATTNLSATLQVTGGIIPITANQIYGVIPPGGSAAEAYSFIAQGTPGATVTATLALTDGTNSLDSVSFPFLIPLTTNYANSASIVIPQFGKATPYPSEILVSGLTNLQGNNLLVSKVTVTLNGFAHTFPHDVNVLLESPSLQELIVMGHAGGPYSATNLTLTFDDAATQSLPVGQLVSGTYLPTDYPPADSFPGLPPASGVEALAIFNGLNPNGYWSLYVYDDTEGNSGVITSGWGLGLTAVNTVNPAALLAASMIQAPDPVFGGNFLTYQITVTNEGPDTASSVVITDTLPATVTFFTATVSQGSATNLGNTVVCSLGSISNGATAIATIRVIAGVAGTIVNTATVSSTSADLYLAESTTVNSTTVETPPSAFLEATNLAAGLQLTLLGQAGQNYAIQTSSNLLIWTSVATNTASLESSSFIYTDTRTNAPLRFYRAIRLTQ